MTDEQHASLLVAIARLETKLEPLIERVSENDKRITKLEKLEVKLLAYVSAAGAGLTLAAKYLLPAVLAIAFVNGAPPEVLVASRLPVLDHVTGML